MGGAPLCFSGADVAFASFRSRYGNSLRASPQPIHSTALNFSLDK
jgi:hypothetical protein